MIILARARERAWETFDYREASTILKSKGLFDEVAQRARLTRQIIRKFNDYFMKKIGK